jgi:AcrR family transcriptional regulator
MDAQAFLAGARNVSKRIVTHEVPSSDVGRPRTIDDGEVLAGAMRAIGRVGPARLTLADVASEAGLAPATLIQRFGSKRGLLLALSEQEAAAAGEHLRQARAEHDSPLAALRSALVESAATVDDPDAFANHLAFLHVEVSDPEFHPHVRAYTAGVLAQVRALLDEAVAAGELRRCDTARLAATVQTTYNGALITWAIYRSGRLAGWLRRELDAVLEPYVVRAGRT